MDKTQEKIARELPKNPYPNIRYNYAIGDCEKADACHYAAYIRAQQDMLRVGYHKLPEGKPPLLSDDGVRKALEKLPPAQILFYQSSYEESSIAWNEFIAQAQRDSDILFYKEVSNGRTRKDNSNG